MNCNSCLCYYINVMESSGNKTETMKNDEIEYLNERDSQISDSTKKLLLLGSGQSGKSTIFKQVLNIYKKQYSKEERFPYIQVIHSNIMHAIKTLIDNLHKFDSIIDVKTNKSIDILRETKLDYPDEDIIEHIKIFWEDESIKNIFFQRSKNKIHIDDSIEYFLNNIDRISKINYIPSDQDIFNARIRTTGIIETTFVWDDCRIKIIDVGGQKNERKKWIHCFENITALIFVSAISEYDQTMYEDDSKNRLHDSLELFDEIANSRWFKKTSIILFLNKRDIFAKKILFIDLNECFSEYDGGLNYNNALNFIIKKFKSVCKENKIYVHVTCATDTSNIKFVFSSLKDTIIRQTLLASGLM